MMSLQNSFEHIPNELSVNTIYQDVFPSKFYPHWHNSVEIIAYTAKASSKDVKSAQVIINGDEINLYPTDIAIAWNGELHSIEKNDKQLIGIQIAQSIFNELADVAPFFPQFKSFNHITSSKTQSIHANLYPHIINIQNLQQSKSLFVASEKRIIVYKMLIAFAEALQKNVQKDNHSPKIHQKMSTICAFIASNCTEELSLASVAHSFNLSEEYFSRTFSACTQCTFVEYLHAQRIKRAERLLAESSLSITEIAFQSGFKSIATFNRVFKTRQGFSPSEFRSLYVK